MLLAIRVIVMTVHVRKERRKQRWLDPSLVCTNTNMAIVIVGGVGGIYDTGYIISRSVYYDPILDMTL